MSLASVLEADASGGGMAQPMLKLVRKIEARGRPWEATVLWSESEEWYTQIGDGWASPPKPPIASDHRRHLAGSRAAFIAGMFRAKVRLPGPSAFASGSKSDTRQTQHWNE
jgi:hypothetical protein